MAASTAAGCYFSEAAVNTSKYPVWGVDVSNWQGTIDWQKLHSQGVSFAFIKATEGSGHTDDSIAPQSRQRIGNGHQDIGISLFQL